MQLALGTVRYPAEMAKPDAGRLPPYHSIAWASNTGPSTQVRL